MQSQSFMLPALGQTVGQFQTVMVAEFKSSRYRQAGRLQVVHIVCGVAIHF